MRILLTVLFCLCVLVGCGEKAVSQAKKESLQVSSNPPTSPSAEPNDVKQPNPWDNPVEFSAWVDNRMRSIDGTPPLRPGQRLRSLDDIVNQSDKKQALVELQERVDDAFKEVFAADGPKLDRVFNLVNIALKQAEVGGQTEAVGNVRKLLQQFEGASSYDQSSGQEEAVYAFVILGEFERAQEVAAKIGIQYMKRRALQFTAKVLVSKGNKKQAVLVLKQALKSARAIDRNNEGARWEGLKLGVLCRIAESLAEAGDKQTALAILNEAKAIVPSLKSAERANLNMPSVHWSIAGTQFAIGNKDEALASLKKALNVTRAIKNPLHQSSRLDYPASLYAKFGENELALKTFKHAVSVAQQFYEEPRHRAGRMLYLATNIAEAGVMKEAVEVAKAIEDVDGVNPPAGIRYTAFQEIARELAFELVPNKYEISHNARPVPVKRLKQVFTHAEQQLAREIVEALKL
jgi:tetratricopeptide (TPR) repeat protein